MSEREQRFRDKLDMGQIVYHQIDRVNQVGTHDYNSGVLIKANNLPIAWKDWIEKQADRYIDEKHYFEYEAPCGIPLGTPQNPCLRDPTKPVLKTEDGLIDWSDPNILSPHLVMVEEINPSEMDSIIMEANEYAGLTYPTDITHSERRE